MTSLHDARDRRAFIRLSLGLSAGALLAGCGGGGGGATESAPVVVVTAPGSAPAPEVPVTAGAHPLNLVLNLAYLGAHFYGQAATGAGPALATGGVGRPGGVSGGRRAALTDPAVAALAAELAADKAAHVTGLRGEIGALAAAQPAIDLSAGAGGAFSRVAQGAGIAGAGFDPYAGDTAFLLGAFVVEHTIAAAYRTCVLAAPDGAVPAVAAANLAEAIYHGGVVRALLDDRARGDATVEPALRSATAFFAALDGTNVGDQTLAGASGASANVIDADGVPIPFTRADAQVLKVLYLSGGGAGGFFPAGVNGLPG